MPNVKETFATIRALGLSVTRVDGEWRITAKQDDVTRFGFSSAEEAAYYTFDNDDAIDTAKYMIQSAKEYCNEGL